MSSAAAQRIITIPLAKYTDSRVFGTGTCFDISHLAKANLTDLKIAIDYRLAPETCFPGPLHDVVSAYLRLIYDLHIPPENILVSGDSAGGGLSLALLMYLRDHAFPLPSGAILMSPWVGECIVMNGQKIAAHFHFDRSDHELRILGIEF